MSAEQENRNILQGAGAGNRPAVSEPDQPLFYGLRTLRQETYIEVGILNSRTAEHRNAHCRVPRKRVTRSVISTFSVK